MSKAISDSYVDVQTVELPGETPLMRAFVRRTASAATAASVAVGALALYEISTPASEANTVVEISRDTTVMSAMDVRRQVLRMRGMDAAEIAEFCDESRFPANLQEELEELEALRRVQLRNARIDSQ